MDGWCGVTAKGGRYDLGTYISDSNNYSADFLLLESEKELKQQCDVLVVFMQFHIYFVPI